MRAAPLLIIVLTATGCAVGEVEGGQIVGAPAAIVSAGVLITEGRARISTFDLPGDPCRRMQDSLLDASSSSLHLDLDADSLAVGVSASADSTVFVRLDEACRATTFSGRNETITTTRFEPETVLDIEFEFDLVEGREGDSVVDSVRGTLSAQVCEEIPSLGPFLDTTCK